ncbi:MAG: hypothetical protein HY892_11845 [Deltaproteobacteria bacterium]|nr:hypothetical protein [Deltaproteobacteria bacterium]
MKRQEELENQGWVRQFMADEPRLSEAVEEYQELGFEVHLEPLDPLQPPEGQECIRCLTADGNRYKIIYTRRKH